MNRKLRMGMVGGGKDAFIGATHRMAASLDGECDLVCGASRAGLCGVSLGGPHETRCVLAHSSNEGGIVRASASTRQLPGASFLPGWTTRLLSLGYRRLRTVRPSRAWAWLDFPASAGTRRSGDDRYPWRNGVEGTRPLEQGS